MFTGIVSDLGRVREVQAPAAGAPGDRRLVIESGWDTAALDVGASVACSGVCLTVVETGPGWFAVDASAETLARTTAPNWTTGTALNLERSLRLGDELGGHLVYGHVDGLAHLEACRSESGSLRLAFTAPEELARYVAPKGSMALDGVSMTVNEVDGARFGVNVIPHTAQATTLGRLQPGEAVNLEIDMLARYVARLLSGGAE